MGVRFSIKKMVPKNSEIIFVLRTILREFSFIFFFFTFSDFVLIKRFAYFNVFICDHNDYFVFRRVHHKTPNDLLGFFFFVLCIVKKKQN